MNGRDPGGWATVAVGAEAEFFVGAVGGGIGAGVFISYGDGKLRLGTYTSSKTGAGFDVGVSVTLHYTDGSLSDFAGKSFSGELDVGPYLTVEAGATLDNSGRITGDSKHIVGFELGVGLPQGGISAAQTEMKATTLLTVDVEGIENDLTDAAVKAAGKALREKTKEVVADKMREAVDNTFKEY